MMEFGIDGGDSGGELSSDDQSLSDGGGAVASCEELPSAGIEDVPDTHYEVLNSDQIARFMLENVEDICAVIQQPSTITRLLLSYSKWDKQKLLERFFSEDRDALFREASIFGLATSKSSTSVSSIPVSTDCGICMTKISSLSSMFALTCGHYFCLECWESYISHCVLNEGLAQTICCAAPGCGTLVDDAEVTNLVQSPRVVEKYQQLISNSFVSCHKLLRWCPGPGCGSAVKVESPETSLVVCDCGEKFCFQCGDVWHEPVLCAWLYKWRLKCSRDSTTSQWIATNTKECPKCHATIEKDGGCNHIVCRGESCMHEFCWVCLGPWQDHGQNAWYNCNRFNEKSSREARTVMEHNREALLRYLHYQSRYSNHHQSLTFEKDIHRKVSSKIAEVQELQGKGWNEVKFLENAVDVLCKCRHTLMNTYVFAYFVTQNNQSLLFEENQRDLECATEQLSEHLERDIYRKEADEMKQKIKDKSKYCTNRCQVLVSHIREGYENGCWQLREEL